MQKTPHRRLLYIIVIGASLGLAYALITVFLYIPKKDNATALTNQTDESITYRDLMGAHVVSNRK
jgi:hypothetical protein